MLSPPDKLGRPSNGGHIEMENVPAVMSRHQKHVKHLEVNRRHGKEIDEGQLLEEDRV